MSELDQTRALQEDEIEVLKSIYGEDFKEVESRTAWKAVNAIFEFAIRIGPMEVEEALRDRVSVKLHFKLPARYPKVVPTILLETPQGLSQSQVTALNTKLQRTASALLGNVMVYELCSTASDFITEWHQVSERGGKQTSLGDQRRQRGEEEDKATALASRAADLLRAQVDAAEAKRLSLLISEDVWIGGAEGRDAVVKLGVATAGDWLGRVLPAEVVVVGTDSPLAASAQVFDILAPYLLTSQGKRKLSKVTSDLDRILHLPLHPHLTREEDLPDPWICPEAREDTFVYDRSRDMWDVGVLFAQMLFGLDVAQRYSSPSDLIRGISRPSTVRKILHDLLLSDSKRRPSASKLSASLLESSQSEPSSSSAHNAHTSTTPQNNPGAAFMRQHHHQPHLSLNNHPNPNTPTTPLFSPQHLVSKSAETPSGFFWQPRQSGSRYRSEFEELEFLGRGGGGQVVKARNRLDGHLYAVKKIRLPNEKANEEKILREVTIWSRMNHPNIVRYHTSWVETDENPQNLDTDNESTALTGTDTGRTESSSGASAHSSNSNSDSDSNSDADFDSDGSAAPGAELDLDLGLDDFDDADFLSVGHSKSVSYPSIHFGNDEDDSRAGSTAANSPMEYVEKLTLKEAIEDGESEVDSWKHMFQILSAMLHFTSLNIIHRDLKPSNIFLDVKGDVRIGDFGLAVNQGLADPADQLLSIESSMDDIDLTSGVGTSLYIAPETLSRGRSDRSVKYSNKIDMYSLGIVFFEFWHPFKTGMERIQVLRELRKPEIVFPSTWDATKLARHTKIVQRCLVHDPEQRASPKDLLNSDLLPPRVGDDSIEETIRLLSHSGTPHAQTLITALFNQTDEDRMRKDFSYDFYDGEGAKVDNDPYGEIVRDKLSRVFRMKGAVCMDSPLLMPHSQIYASRKPVRLLDADGTVVCLPFQLNIPFCRMVARDTALTRLKRWTIAPVYRTSTAGGQPRAVLNAAFDIVSDAVTAASEAECIYVVEELMASFPFPGETIHIINHSKILDAVVEKVPTKRRAEVLDVLVHHGRLQRLWSKTAAELMKIQGVTRATVDEMGALDFYGTIEETRSRIMAAVPRLRHLVQEGFDELQDIVTLALQLGVKNIKFSPLLATNWDFHRAGALFEAHHVKGKVRDVIAAGGRFDDVVSRLAAPEVRNSGRCPHVVGVSISVAKLSIAAAESNTATSKKISTMKETNRSYGSWAVRRCDVYVVSFSPNLIERRLDVWKAGIKADLMYDDNLLTLTPEQLVNACRREGILWLVMVKQGADRSMSTYESDKILLKVKSVLRGDEDEVPRSELTTYIAKEMRDQYIVDDRHSGAAGAVLEQQADPSSLLEAPRSTQEFFPILIDEGKHQKGKHKQRTMIINRAQKNVEQRTADAAEAPVFAIDVDGAAFKAMTHSTAWISDDDAYRTVVQSSPPSKRDYLNSIRHTIRKHKTPGTSFWLFSLRDDCSVLLTFPDRLS
ncbi:hypothetical protein RQP46_003304 [Phenoliferia psychrophenolica]